MFVLVTCKNEEDPIKNEGAGEAIFSQLRVNGIHPFAWKQVLIQSASLSSTPLILQIKGCCDGPDGLRDIYV